MKKIITFFHVLAAVVLFAGSVSSDIRITAPSNGAEECLLTSIQYKFVKMNGEERRAKFTDEAWRKEMTSGGYMPRPVTLAWKNAKYASEYTVMLSTTKDFAEGTVVVYTSKTNILKVDNLLIATNYYWKVSDGKFESEVSSFKTADVAPRLIRAPKVRNARDLGGWIGMDGRRVKQGMIYRTGGMNGNSKLIYCTDEELPKGSKKGDKVVKLDADGKQMFTAGAPIVNDEGRKILVKDLGVKIEIDLRSPEEVLGITESHMGPEVKWMSFPFYGYSGVKSSLSRNTLNGLFKVLVDEKNYPLDFHCIAGADRTGTLAFVLNGLLGVSEKDLVLDWEVTAFATPSNKWVHEGNLDELLKVINKFEGATINERIENFMLSIGIAQEDIQRFREIMLEK